MLTDVLDAARATGVAMGVGQSNDADASEAAAIAVSSALSGCQSPKLLIVFASSRYSELQALVKTANAVACELSPAIRVVGCTTAGEIGPTEVTTKSVVAIALGGQIRVATRMVENVSADLRGSAERAALVFDELSYRQDNYNVVLLLSDGLSGDQQEVIRGAYRATGPAVALVGGCAGDDMEMKRTYQFIGNRLVSNAIISIALSSPSPIGIGVKHGWSKRGVPLRVTSSNGCTVLTLDDEPALDKYLACLGIDPATVPDSQSFAKIALTHPLGLDRRRSHEIRFMVGADFERRSIRSIASVPQGALTWVMEGNAESVRLAARFASLDAIAELGGLAPSGVIAFDCCARAAILGGEVRAEVDEINSVIAGAPLGGIYTYGEFARTAGTTGFHNQTLVVLAFS